MLVPQSPRANRPTQVANCEASGLSRSRARRCAASCSAVAVGPSIIRTGSPGPRDSRNVPVRLRTDVRWHNGTLTTPHHVAWTLNAARDPATGYLRLTDVADIASVTALNDSTVALRFRSRPAFEHVPDVLTDLAILPAHLLDSVPHARLRTAAWNARPVGNGPFRFVAHEPNSRGVLAKNAAFPP